MTNEELQQVILQMKNAVAILENPDTPALTKINTMERVGVICSYKARKWGEETYNKFLDNLSTEVV